jgi:hypothetical protein
MNASERAQAMRRAIVATLEDHCARNEFPVHWRMKDGRAERGIETRRGSIVWRKIPFLSAYLCQLYREEIELEQNEIPF